MVEGDKGNYQLNHQKVVVVLSCIKTGDVFHSQQAIKILSKYKVAVFMFEE